MTEKTAILQAATTVLRGRHTALLKAAEDARSGATDSENKSEGKYDTRGLEASYLAAGQADQALELGSAVAALESFKVEDFPPGSAAELGALVAVETGGFTDRYLLVPAGGGIEVDDVTTLTPGTPLGKLLLGKRAGETFRVRPGAPEAAVREVR